MPHPLLKATALALAAGLAAALEVALAGPTATSAVSPVPISINRCQPDPSILKGPCETDIIPRCKRDHGILMRWTGPDCVTKKRVGGQIVTVYSGTGGCQCGSDIRDGPYCGFTCRCQAPCRRASGPSSQCVSPKPVTYLPNSCALANSKSPTVKPTTKSPSKKPTTKSPTKKPVVTPSVSTGSPVASPVCSRRLSEGMSSEDARRLGCGPIPTPSPSTGSPSTGSPSTGSPSTGSPSTGSPSTGSPSTGSPVASPVCLRRLSESDGKFMSSEEARRLGCGPPPSPAPIFIPSPIASPIGPPPSPAPIFIPSPIASPVGPPTCPGRRRQLRARGLTFDPCFTSAPTFPSASPTTPTESPTTPTESPTTPTESPTTPTESPTTPTESPTTPTESPTTPTDSPTTPTDSPSLVTDVPTSTPICYIRRRQLGEERARELYGCIP